VPSHRALSRAVERKERADRLERIGMKALDHLPAIGGAALGVLALRPQRFSVLDSFRESLGTDPPTATWAFHFKVDVLAQNLMPNVEIPIAGWQVRDALALTMWKRKTVDVLPGEGINEQRVRAQRSAESEVEMELLAVGFAGGLIGTELLKAFGTIMRGLGEIVPG